MSEVALLPIAPGAFLSQGIGQAIGAELHELEDLATKGVADRFRPLRTTVLEDVMQQRRNDLVLVATIALNQGRHRNRVRDVRQWQAKSVLGPFANLACVRTKGERQRGVELLGHEMGS